MSKRRHYTQSEREQWLAQFDQNHSTAVGFCKEHGLCYQTFLRWRRTNTKHHSLSSNTEPFIELDLSAPPAPSSRGDEVELTFPGGLTLRIQSRSNRPAQP